MKWKHVFLVLMVLSGVGLEQGFGGPVMDVPPGGGGGGGRRNSDIGQNASFNNDYDQETGEWRGYANGNFNGEFVVTQLSTSLSVYPNSDPEPGNLGTFHFSMSGNGYVPEDPATDHSIQFQLDHPLGTNNSWTINQVELYIDPERGYQWLQFTPTMRINGNANGSIYLDPETDWFNYSLYSNVNVEGGVFTNTYVSFERNQWTGEGEPPEYFDELWFNFNADGMITAENWSIVPEPATAVLLAIGGGAGLWRWRRQRSREPNLIA